MTSPDENQPDQTAEMEVEEHDVLFLPRELIVASTRFLPTDADGDLQLEANRVIRYELGFALIEDRGDEDAICTVVRITDSTGVQWVGQSILWPSELIGQLGSLATVQQPQFFSEATKEIQKAFTKNLLISEAKVLLNFGFGRPLHFGDRVVELVARDESPRMDLAFFGGGATILARVSGLYGRYADDTEDEIPPIVFQVDLDKRLFITYGYMGDDGLWHEDNIPYTVLMEKSDNVGPRGINNHVTFVEE